MTTTMYEMQNMLNGNNNKLDLTGEKIGETEFDIAIKTIQSESNKGGNELRISDSRTT